MSFKLHLWRATSATAVMALTLAGSFGAPLLLVIATPFLVAAIATTTVVETLKLSLKKS